MNTETAAPIVIPQSPFSEGGSQAPARGEFAVFCRDVRKQFPIFKQGKAWKVILGMQHRDEVIEALRGISLTVPKGRILGVLGRNGAGKSTLLRILAGVYSPTDGEVAIRGDLASLFELGGLGTRFITGREYAERLLRFQGVGGRQLAELVEEAKEFSELGSFFERRIYTYSSGMAARLYFAVATAIQKEVYLIDELLSVGDEHFQAKCWRRLRDRLGQGASGVLVTHDWSAVIKLCEQSVVLSKGEVVQSGTSDQVVATYLDLPPPDNSIARFGDLPDIFSAAPGEDWEVDIPVEVLQQEQFEFAFSIELLRLGLGWEILVLSKFHLIATHEGKYSIRLCIPKLPLGPGRYSLNLFLRRKLPDGPATTCDIRTWTAGNGLSLVIQGRPSNTAFRIPVRWRAREKNHACH